MWHMQAKHGEIGQCIDEIVTGQGECRCTGGRSMVRCGAVPISPGAVRECSPRNAGERLTDRLSVALTLAMSATPASWKCLDRVSSAGVAMSCPACEGGKKMFFLQRPHDADGMSAPSTNHKEWGQVSSLHPLRIKHGVLSCLY